jgi:hypothetical protein
MLIDENAHFFSSDPISFLFTFLQFDRLVLSDLMSHCLFLSDLIGNFSFFLAIFLAHV